MKITTSAVAAGLLLALPNIALTGALAAQESPDPKTPTPTPQDAADEPTWYFEQSDLPVDPGYVFGQLDNGMRFILRQNATPEGTALVRMRVGSGSLDEADSERGLSHYLEHMAFNGSTNIPEGEMVALLEREGLAFGADTNASTGYEAITYMLNLPRNDDELLGTALMLMRETASELTIAQDAVDRERGVILAERRDRSGFAQRAQEDNLEFIAPGARFTERLPIGTLDVLENASSEQLRALYERVYTPSNTVIVIVGDIPVEKMEAAIRERFSDWKAAPAPVDPETGPIDVTREGLVDIFTDPALSETVSIAKLGPWIDEPDTLAQRKLNQLRRIGYGIIARRLGRLARGEDAPFRGASFSSNDLFEDARATSISIATEDGKWRAGMLAALREVNQALEFGFTRAEVNEQLANIRTSLENSVAGGDTRSNSGYTGGALRLVSNNIVPTTPESRLARFEENVGSITPDSILEALKSDAVPLRNPLIRFQGRTAPDGGEGALTAAFYEGINLPITAPHDAGVVEFGYTDFGEPGTIVADTQDERLGFRYVTFANGVRLTLKQTDIREDRISYRVSLDGGDLLNTREDPLATYLVPSLPAGGLGKHSQDELLSILAGHSVGLRVGSGAEAFTFAGTTTPRDFELQMQVITAGVTDPGYRREGLEQYRRGIDNFFETLTATPGRAFATASGAILSDNDPRFSLQSRDDFYALDFAKLQTVIGDRLEKGAIEIALVGDLDEEAAIAAVAKTLGALPPRETDFLPRESARNRSFTAERGERVLRHEGEADQALLRLVWPTTDDSDFTEATRLALLARVTQIELTERLREQLGQAYSPGASSGTSRIYPDYGTFSISASVAVAQVEPAREAVIALINDLRSKPLDPDIIDRAREPLLEAYDNSLKSLGGWMRLAARAQSENERLDRWFAGPETVMSITAEDLQAAAIQYLTPADAVQFLVLPEEESEAPPSE